MKRIKITIPPDGTETKVAVEGCPGKSCKDLTRQLEAALGETSTDKTTPEYLQNAPIQTRHQA